MELLTSIWDFGPVFAGCRWIGDGVSGLQSGGWPTIDALFSHDIGLGLFAASSFAATMDMAVNILWVAVGLGLVIFFHELGHFAVAKWCDVHVERFSIGFGPILWSRKKGETEYALSAIPFGGYVKMLGQDDMDPSQLSSEEIAQDPRSYSAKPVRQRMAIISAGVTMNVITGLLFFAIAFRLGVEQIPSIVGGTQAGSPAWKAGLQPGDRITRINDRQVESFGDIMRGVALSSGKVSVGVRRPDGSDYAVSIAPDERGTRRIIGVSPAESLDVIDVPDGSVPPTKPGTPAAAAKPPFRPGDRLRRVGEAAIESHAQLARLLAARRSETLDLFVNRHGDSAEKLVRISLPPQPFRTFGFWTDIGKVTAVETGSPAEKNGLKPGDKITHVDGKAMGNEMDPLRLPDYFAAHAGEEVVIEVSRPVVGADPEKVTLRLVPTDDPPWLSPPVGPNIPVAVPAAGFAFHLIPTILKVDPEGPAAEAGIHEDARIQSVTFTLPEGADADGLGARTITIEAIEEGQSVKSQNWAYAFWTLQRAPTRTVTLTLLDTQGQPGTVPLDPQPADDWFVPGDRGLRLFHLSEVQQATGVFTAVRMGLTHTHNSITDIYLTLRNLIGGRLSPKELHGPVGIAKVAYEVARQGTAELLLFLGFLSINLAVLNFLPIPVLDGGHMVFLCWEAITRKKPSERVMAAATYVGMAFVLALMVFVLYLDLFVHRGG